MDAVAAKSYSEQYEQMLREQLKQALDSIDRQEQAQVNRYDTELARVEAARQDALRGAYADYAHNINPYGIQAESAYANEACAARARARRRLRTITTHIRTCWPRCTASKTSRRATCAWTWRMRSRKTRRPARRRAAAHIIIY